MSDDLRRRLREAAAAHRPDRERMLARVERGTTAAGRAPVPRRPGRAAPWLRVVGATAAVAAVLAAGGYGASAVLSGQGRPVSAAPPAHSTPPDGPRTEDGPLWSDGSVDPHSNAYWAQSNVTLKAAEPLTSLVVELRIARTEGVRPTGAWRTLPPDDFVFTTDTEDGFLVYRWRLKPGRTVPAGTHVFAGQYDHARGGRDAAADSYTASARSGGERPTVRGDFAPHNG